MATRDAPLIERMAEFLGFRPPLLRPPSTKGVLPIVTLSVQAKRDLLGTVIPLMDKVLLPGRKRTQYEAWRTEFMEYLEWVALQRICEVDGCDRRVRGRGLCRSHYYQATGY